MNTRAVRYIARKEDFSKALVDFDFLKAEAIRENGEVYSTRFNSYIKTIRTEGNYFLVNFGGNTEHEIHLI